VRFIVESWRAAWIRRRAELVFTGSALVGFIVVYEVILRLT
jgi:hypothetical protein